MPGHEPYYVTSDRFRAGDDGIIIPIEGALRVDPTVDEEQAVSNNHPPL